MSGIEVEQRYKRLAEKITNVGIKDNYQKQVLKNEIINEFLELEKVATQTCSTDEYNLLQNNINLVSDYVETNFKTLENIQKTMNDKLDHKKIIIQNNFEYLKQQEMDNIVSINEQIDQGIDNISQTYADFSKQKLDQLQSNTLKASKNLKTIDIRYREFIESSRDSAEDLENDLSNQLVT